MIELQCPIFSQTWWLDAVAPGQWDETVVVENGTLVARMPYRWRRRYGLRILTNPPLTPFVGPWLAINSTKYAEQLAKSHHLLQSLIDELPPFDFLSVNFHHSVTNYLPFIWAGHRQTTRYTYVLPDLRDRDKIWSQLRSSARRNIRRARNIVAIREDGELDVLWALCRKTFARQERQLPFKRDLLTRVIEACRTHDCARILVAEDAAGNPHAAALIVWDSESAYYLMGGFDEEYGESRAMHLLLWEAIGMAAQFTLTFDFEGSMIPSIERFFRSFGAEQRRYAHFTAARHPILDAVAGFRSRV